MKNYRSQVHRFLGRCLEVSFLNPFENGIKFQNKLFQKDLEPLPKPNPKYMGGGGGAEMLPPPAPYPPVLKIPSNRPGQIG